MKKLIVKYIIIHIASILVANLIGLLLHFILRQTGYDLYYFPKLMSWGPKTLYFSIRVAIALIVLADMRRAYNKINYPILVLILINQYYGTAFFLLSVFFQNYKSINIFKNAKPN